MQLKCNGSHIDFFHKNVETYRRKSLNGMKKANKFLKYVIDMIHCTRKKWAHSYYRASDFAESPTFHPID
jgi:hypothetical protein